MNKYVELYNPVGFALGVINNQELIYAKGFCIKNIKENSPAATSSVFHMASVSKLVAATAIMKIVENSVINIDYPVVHYFPYFKMNDARYKDITIRHILTHTSGIPTEEDEEDYGWENPQYDSLSAERFVKSLTIRKLQFNPGEKRRYSNFAYNILADVVLKVTGMSFEMYMEKYIFQPLEMYN